MGVEENRAVVRRFIENVPTGRDFSVTDEVIAPDYVNLAVPGVAIADLTAMEAAMHAAVGAPRIGPLELVAEDDAVFARFDYTINLPGGGERTSRVLAYYHLTDGKIDVNDVMFTPGLDDVIGSLMGPPPTDQ